MNVRMFALGAALTVTVAPLSAQTYDVVIRGGTVVDGTGAPRFTADVAVADGRIALISREGIDPTLARTVIDAGGQVVTPGFIEHPKSRQDCITTFLIRIVGLT